MTPMPPEHDIDLREQLEQQTIRAEAAESELREVLSQHGADVTSARAPFGKWSIMQRCSVVTGEVLLAEFNRLSRKVATELAVSGRSTHPLDSDLVILRMELKHRLGRFDQIRAAFTEGKVILGDAGVKELYEALAAAIAAMPDPKKNAENPHFRNTFADLRQVLDCIEQPLAAHQLLLVQTPETPDLTQPDRVFLRTRLVHRPSEQVLEFHYPLLAKQLDSQGMGSAITYARRYTIKSLFGMVDVDDDGNRTSQKQQPQQQRASNGRQQPQQQRSNGPSEFDRVVAMINSATTIEGLEVAGKAAGKLSAEDKKRCKPIYVQRRDAILAAQESKAGTASTEQAKAMVISGGDDGPPLHLVNKAGDVAKPSIDDLAYMAMRPVGDRLWFLDGSDWVPIGKKDKARRQRVEELLRSQCRVLARPYAKDADLEEVAQELFATLNAKEKA